MNKSLIKILLSIWIFIAVGLTGILVYGIVCNRSLGSLFTFTFAGGADMIQKDEQVSLDSCNNINLEFPSDDIILRVTDDAKLRVVQSASTKLPENQKFTISKDGDSILVNKREVIHIFSFGCWNEKIEVYIPKSYSKNLNIRSSSGNVNFDSDMTLADLNCTLSSGNIHIYKNITANEVTLKASSGNINIQALGCSVYNVSTSSGNIDINSVSGSGGVFASSGNIKIDYKDIKDYSTAEAHSGNVRLTVPKELSFEFNGQCSSGDIDSNFDLSYKNKKGNQASGKVGDGPYKKINTRTTSGNIRISSK